MSTAAFFLAFSLAAAPSPPPEEVYGALWYDIERNAMIGNGNALVSLDWANGPDNDHPVKLRILDLSCRTFLGTASCRFRLARDRDRASAIPDREPQPPLLECRAQLRRFKEKDGSSIWSVVHSPPGPEGGHSLTSMRCRVPRSRGLDPVR